MAEKHRPIVMRVRLTPTEHALMKKAAAERRQSLGAWLGNAAGDRLKRDGHVPPEYVPEQEAS